MNRDRLTMLSLTAALIGVTSVELALLGARWVARGLGHSRIARIARVARSARVAPLPGPASA